MAGAREVAYLRYRDTDLVQVASDPEVIVYEQSCATAARMLKCLRWHVRELNRR